MKTIFADRIGGVPRSFIRDILKVANDKDIISFAGGLPNPLLFPVSEIQEATHQVLSSTGPQALQYSNSEGFLELRKVIAKKYKQKQGLDIPVEQILVTSGSQQALDLLGKIFVNEGDQVIMEEPGYLGAIQALSVYRPEFLSVPLNDDGLDVNVLANTIANNRARLMYAVPNFQNPSGISYSTETRIKVADLLRGTDIILIEDDPYGELRFKGKASSSFRALLPEQTIMLGTFSKTVVPSFRIGWIVASPEIMEKLIVAKQAADLHTNFFCQMILHKYFELFDNQEHINLVSAAYGKQCNAMVAAIQRYFPTEVRYTKPEGGMFVWASLPEGFSSMKLLDMAMKRKVIFVPGNQFYTNRSGDVNTFRLNFTCSDEESIDKGIKILSEAIHELISCKN